MNTGLNTTFYPLGDTQPSLTLINVSFFHTWEALRNELALNYDEDPEKFETSEASWKFEEEYAEVVTLKGRIIGSLDRSITQEDVAAIWGVDRMEKRTFANLIRSLFNIDSDLLPELKREEQSAFLRNPVQFFLDATDAQSDAIMREVQARQGIATPQVAAFKATAKTEQDANQSVAARLPRTKKQKPRIDGQREMLLPITGGAGEAAKVAAAPTIGRKAG